MRFAPALLVLLLVSHVLAGLAHAAPPQAMTFNMSPSADAKAPIVGVAMDGSGRTGAVAMADDATRALDADRDLRVYNLQSLSFWEARDDDLVNEGARRVVVANGTADGVGQWIFLVNNTVGALLSAYQVSGIGVGATPGAPAWQLDVASATGAATSADAGAINGLSTNGEGTLLGIATGLAKQNATLLLVRNRFAQGQAPLVVYKANTTNAPFNEVTRFTAVAVATNASVPSQPTSTRSTYTVLGAETLTTSVKGAIFVLETNWTDLERPQTRSILRWDTNAAVTSVDITKDGEYAVAGTADGQVYLVSVGEALARRGAQGLQPPLRPKQQTVGSPGNAVTAVAIAHEGGELFAAGTQDGDVVLFRNRFDYDRSEGANPVQVGRSNTNTPSCSPRLSEAVHSLAMSEDGGQVLAGARNGILAFEALAFARFAPGPFEPAWCIAYTGGDVRDGVSVDISGDSRRIVAGTGQRVFGYRNFFKFALEPDSERKAGAPGQRVQWAVTVRNDGSLFDRVNLSLVGPTTPGWQLSLSNSSLLLMPGKSQTVLINVTTPPDLSPNNFTVDLIATPERAGIDQKIVQRLQLDLGKIRRVELKPPPGILVASQGVQNAFTVTVRNGGNDVDRFRVFAKIPEPEDSFKSPGSDWIIRTNVTEIDVPANSDAAVSLLVTPQRANRGDSAIIEVTVEAAVPDPDGTVIGDAKTVTVAVEPSYHGDISLKDTGDFRAEPGQTILINYTIKNLGNTRDIFLIKNYTDPANAQGWRLQLSDERIELRRQNEEKTIRLAVSAQQGLQPGESVRIVVDLGSEGLAKSGGDGQVDSQRVTVTVVPPQRRGVLGAPLAPEPLILLGILGVALLARRRGA